MCTFNVPFDGQHQISIGNKMINGKYDPIPTF